LKKAAEREKRKQSIIKNEIDVKRESAEETLQQIQPSNDFIAREGAAATAAVRENDVQLLREREIVMGKLSPTGSSPVRRTTEPDAGSISSFQRTVNPIGYVRPEAESTSSVDQGTSYFAATAAAAAETTNPTRQDFIQQTEPFGQAIDPNQQQQQQALYQDDFLGQAMDTSYEYDEEQPMDPQVPTAAPGAAPTSFIRQTVNPNGSVRHGGVNGIIVGCNNVRPFRGRSEDIAEVSGWDQLQDDLGARQSQNTDGSNSWSNDPAESRGSPSQKRLVVDSTANASDRNNIDSSDDWIQSVVERFPKDSGDGTNLRIAKKLTAREYTLEELKELRTAQRRRIIQS
ncbi:unnamed protein product, partial [Gongylonema pulchrum]|uniref:Clathrin light chain n=1 Tax=Gongylonema pulchrum TaxID=637853 RepID=A0A183DDN2_9BILA